MKNFSTPQDVTDLDLAFGARDISKLMPAYADIPQEFKDGRTKYNKLFSTWFFSGIKASEFTAKPGIDKQKALRHIGAFIGSFEPKHEHKEAAAAYLMSLWFE